jgi:hypothetical protein
MSRDEMLIRMGFYVGLAARDLGDTSYADRWMGHAQDLTPEAYWQTVAEIFGRLREAGKLRADEDPFETVMAGGR